MVLSWSEAGKTRLITVGQGDLRRMVRMTAEYRKFRKARAALVKLQKELLGEVDRLEGAIREGPVKAGED
jgi:plasmid replication initiation protein